MLKELSIGKIIYAKRKELGLTQEELAEYLGISKPAVSKWESGQSYPDITLLPVIASYFNISVDCLLGYEPQLDQEKIRNHYLHLCQLANQGHFDKALAECREYCKKYSSCWELLLLMGQWIINYHQLASSPSQPHELLHEALGLFQRIEKHGSDHHLASQALEMQAYCYLALGDPDSTIRLLENRKEINISPQLLLSQAYKMKGNNAKAKEVLQVSLYYGVVLLFNILPNMSILYIDEPTKVEQCRRIGQMASDAFDLIHLHPILLLSFLLPLSISYAKQANWEKCLDVLEEYTDIALSPQTFPLHLKGNDFFDQLDGYFSSLSLGNALPRDENSIRQSLASSLEVVPEFSVLRDHPRFLAMQERLSRLKSAQKQ